MSESEMYYALMNLLDDVALGKEKYVDVENEILSLSSTYNFTPQDVGDANDCYGNNWQEVIDGLKRNFENGTRVDISEV